MQTFTVDPRRWWIGRLFGRNPLLRPGDRIEVLAIVLAFVVSLTAIAVAGAVGAEVHNAERDADAKQLQTHHLMSASITEVSSATNFDGTEMRVVRADWTAGNRSHTDLLQWSDNVKVGDLIQIWVDDGGNHADIPAPARPVLDAFAIAGSIVLLVGVSLTSMLALLHWRLQRVRDAQWDREIRSLANDGDGGQRRHTG